MGNNKKNPLPVEFLVPIMVGNLISMKYVTFFSILPLTQIVYMVCFICIAAMSSSSTSIRDSNCSTSIDYGNIDSQLVQNVQDGEISRKNLPEWEQHNDVMDASWQELPESVMEQTTIGSEANNEDQEVLIPGSGQLSSSHDLSLESITKNTCGEDNDVDDLPEQVPDNVMQDSYRWNDRKGKLFLRDTTSDYNDHWKYLYPREFCGKIGEGQGTQYRFVDSYKCHIHGNEDHRVNTINVERHTCSRNGIYMWDDGFRYMPISTCYAGYLQSKHLEKFEQLNRHIVETDTR